MNVTELGQVFTPDNIVRKMMSLIQNKGTILEPSAGNGSFIKKLPPWAVGVEIDSSIAPKGCQCMDFFDFPIKEKFDTIIGNPPYVAFKNITSETKKKLDLTNFDKRTNLYLFFINKCLDHLKPGGELIFITPRDFLKATSARRMNRKLFELGTITHFYDLGDASIFKGYNPNCIVWRFQKDDFSRITNSKTFLCTNGQLLFISQNYTIPFKNLFNIKVGAVSGMDAIFSSKSPQATDFVFSKTQVTGATRRMLLVDRPVPHLQQHKEVLLQRGIRKFDESNWWEWGRKHHISDKDRIYVNCRTRHSAPFYTHPCKNYDGSVLAIFPHDDSICCRRASDKLNQVDWEELGFVCDGRFIFSQRSLQEALLPEWLGDELFQPNLS